MKWIRHEYYEGAYVLTDNDFEGAFATHMDYDRIDGIKPAAIDFGDNTMWIHLNGLPPSGIGWEKSSPEHLRWMFDHPDETWMEVLL